MKLVICICISYIYTYLHIYIIYRVISVSSSRTVSEHCLAAKTLPTSTYYLVFLPLYLLPLLLVCLCPFLRLSFSRHTRRVCEANKFSAHVHLSVTILTLLCAIPFWLAPPLSPALALLLCIYLYMLAAFLSHFFFGLRVRPLFISVLLF